MPLPKETAARSTSGLLAIAHEPKQPWPCPALLQAPSCSYTHLLPAALHLPRRRGATAAREQPRPELGGSGGVNRQQAQPPAAGQARVDCMPGVRGTTGTVARANANSTRLTRGAGAGAGTKPAHGGRGRGRGQG